MAGHKIACPGCRKSLHITQALPARIVCPQCQTRFVAKAAAAAAKTLVPANEPAMALTAPPAAAPPAAGRLAPLPEAPLPLVSAPPTGKRAGSPLFWTGLAGGVVAGAAL